MAIKETANTIKTLKIILSLGAFTCVLLLLFMIKSMTMAMIISACI
jgi:hypothetical protein